MGAVPVSRKPARLAAALIWMGLTCLPAWGTDFLEVYHLAQANDPTFEAARYTLEATRQKIPQARAGLLPTVNVTGNDGHTSASTTFTGTPPMDRGTHSWTWTLQLTQPLLRVQNIFAYQESESLVEQAIAQYAQAEQDLVLRVSQAYFDVVVAQESIAVAEAQVKAMEEQLAQAKRGFQAGTHAITDVYEAKSRKDLATSQLVAARNDLVTKRAELEKAVGPLTGPLATLRPAVVTPEPQPKDVQAWIDQARENNPVVRAQKAAFEAAEAEVRRNRAEHLPTVDITASYGKNASSGSLTTPVDYATYARTEQAGVQVNIPIFAGGATSARVAEAQANKYKAQAEMEVARRQAATDARQAYAGIENGLAQIEALDSAVDSSKFAVKGNKVGFGLGIRMNIDVLNAEQQFYTAQRDLAKARYDTLLQGLKLKAAAGVLTEEDVVTINGLLAVRTAN